MFVRVVNAVPKWLIRLENDAIVPVVFQGVFDGFKYNFL